MNKLEKIIKEKDLGIQEIRNLCNNEISTWSHYLKTTLKIGIVSFAFFAVSSFAYLNNRSDSARNIAALSGLAVAGSYVGLRRTLKELSEISTILKDSYHENENSNRSEYNAN